MNTQFSQPNKVVAVETNKQSIARNFGVKSSEVVYAKDGVDLNGYKVIYDKATQRSYALPSTLVPAEVFQSMVNGLLITSKSTYDLALLAVQRGEFVKLVKDFASGFTIEAKNEVVLSNNTFYRWGGEYPKVVTANGSPQSTGGINANAWIAVGISNVNNNSVSLVSFGADDTGTIDTTDQIIAAFAYAADNNLDVVQNSGSFIISKAVPMSSRLIDLSGCNLLMRGGEFQYSQKAKPVTYDSTTQEGTALLAAINATSANSRSEGTTKLDGLANNTVLNNKFIILHAPQQMFKYRDTDGILTRVEYNRVYAHGKLESAIRYALPTTVNSCYALPINRFVSVIRGFNFVLNGSSRYRACLVTDSSRVHITGCSVDGIPIDGTKEFFLFEKVRCYDVVVEGYDTPTTFKVVDGTTGGARSSYCMSMSDCMNVRYQDVHANGDGWGSTGNNNSSRITYNNCKLSRIDFHMPFRDYMRIENCDLGRDGIVITGIGDLFITNSTFSPSTDTTGTSVFNGNVIATRGDAGGWFDGDLYMNNVVIRGRFDSYLSNKGIISANTEASDRGPVAGSPINDTLFNNIYIDGLSFESQGLQTHIPNLLMCSNDNAVKFPRSVNVRNFNTNYAKSSGVGLIIPLNNFAAVEDSALADADSSVSKSFTTNINLDNINATHLSVVANSGRHNPKISGRNIRNDRFAETSTTFATNQRGTYEFHACEFDNLRAVYSSTPNGVVRIKMIGGKITAASREIISGSPSSHHIQLNSVDIVSDFTADTGFAAAKNLLQYAVLNNCNFFDTSGTKLKGLTVWQGTATNVSPALNIKTGNMLSLACGYSSNSSYAINKVEVPAATAKAWIYLGGSTSASLSFTGAGNGVTTVSNITAPAGTEAVELFVS